MKFFIAILALGAFTPLSHAAIPADNQDLKPRNVVEYIIDRAKQLDQAAQRAANTQAIERLVDFQKLADDALGDNASRASTAQRTQIRSLLKQILTKTIYPEAPKFFRDVAVQFTTEDTEGAETAHITSIVTKGTHRSTVEYWLQKQGGSYRVVDIAIEGERWVENVHSQFDELIRKHGVADLIARMQKRLREITKTRS